MSYSEIKNLAEMLVVNLWSRFRNGDETVTNEKIETACEAYWQAHLAWAAYRAHEERVLWESREQADPGYHVRAEIGREQTAKIEKMWVCHCGKHAEQRG